MAENVIKTSGPTKASKNDAGGGVLRSEPVLGVVKNNIDPTRAGRIQVFIEDFNGPDPEDSNSWTTVGFMNPFYGRSYPSGASDSGYGDYAANPVSYGEWHAPPEIGTRVICIFINGDPNYGYYIGSVMEPEALTMVPAIGAIDSDVVLNDGESTALAGATQIPVTNLNSNDSSLADGNNFLDAPKPVHSYVASVLAQQGLIRDNIRGPITSSAQRETPSRVGWGVSTPGRPIYDGGYTDETIGDAVDNPDPNSSTKIISRRAGHTFVMDDGDLEGNDQLIRLRTSLGHQILMSDDGQCLFIIHANGQSWIELGSEGTIDMFATNSVNIRTQGDLNLHADRDVNINAANNLNIHAKKNIAINSDKETDIRTGTDFKHQVIKNFTTKVGGTMSMGASGEGSYASNGVMYVNGSKINLNTGSTSLPPPEVKPIPIIAQTDTLFDDEKGFAPAPGKLETIVTRAPAHQPWANAGQGVDIKVSNNADDQLPDSPSDSLQSANDASPSSTDVPVSLAAGATVPNVGAVSDSLSSGTTASLVSAVAAQTGTTVPNINSVGSAITNGVPQVGQLGQTASQMIAGGAIKPGADTLINGLVSNGASTTGAMTNNLFTNQAGAQSLTTFANDTTAQVQSTVSNLGQSQNQLTQAGLITGNESSGAIAGVVLAGAQNGAGAVAGFVNGVSGNPASAALSAASGGLGNVTGVAKNIGLGNLSSGLATNLSGALSGIAGSLGSALNNAMGVVASAFGAITGAYKTFTPGIPQNIKAIAQAPSSSSSLSLNSVIPTVTDPNAFAAQSASSLAAAQSGLQGLPGGAQTIASVVNNAPGAINSIPGASVVNSVMSNTTTGLMNNIPTSVAGAASAASGIANGSLPSVGALTGGISGSSSLLSSVSSVLSPDLSAQLNSAVSAISAGGPNGTKLPTVATNTLNRTGFTTQMTSVLGNPKVPTPQYGGTSAYLNSVQAETASIQAHNAQREALSAKADASFEKFKAARTAYQTAIDNYPPGDPVIVSAREDYYAAKATALADNQAVIDFLSA